MARIGYSSTANSCREDQFAYKWTITENQERTILQARIGQGLALVVAGSVVAGALEKSVQDLRAEGADRGQVVILQSSVLASFDG